MKKKLIELLNEILRQEKIYMKKALDEDISTRNIHLILCISELSSQNENITVSDISEYLGLTKSTVNNNINKLINKGYIYKKPSENNKLQYNIFLTYNGEYVVEEYNNFKEMIFENLTKQNTSEEIEVIVSALDDLSTYFK